MKKGSFNSVGFALFCIFFRNGISVMASMAIISVGYDVITGFYGAVKTTMFSIYVSPVGLKVGYCQDMWWLSMRVFRAMVSIYQRFLVDTDKELDFYQPIPL